MGLGHRLGVLLLCCDSLLGLQTSAEVPLPTVMATLDCQLDYIWNKLKPRWLGTSMRDCFLKSGKTHF